MKSAKDKKIGVSSAVNDLNLEVKRTMNAVHDVKNIRNSVTIHAK